VATTTRKERERLPRSFEALVRLLQPRAIADDASHEESIEMIDRLMAAGRLTQGQEAYLETLVQLVEAYEAQHHAIDTSRIRGIDALKHLLAENDMNASDLARLLGLHPSMGSKILNGERSLTANHLRKLAGRFKVGPELFL